MYYFRLLLTALAAALSSSGQCQTFHDFLTRLNIAPMEERPAIVDSFMNAADSFPYIEYDTLAHFIYRGGANSAALAGDANNWDADGTHLINVAGTDFWHYTSSYESDARLDYKYVLPGNNWILDPLNPYTVSGGFGPNSELRMPDHVPPPEINFYPEIGHGAIRDSMFFSATMNNTRRIRVYTPPGYDTSADDYPLVVVHDGLEYLSLAWMNRVLDFLIHQQRMEPVIAVFVPPVNREPEYAGSLQDEFGAFITAELLPWVDSEYRTRSEPRERATMGASNGGNISLWLGGTYPEQFGKIAAYSSNVEQNVLSLYDQEPPLDLELYLDMGTYDIPLLPPRVDALRAILDDRSYDYDYYEWHEGHSWGNWRAHIDLAMTQFFPGVVVVDPTSAPLPMTVELLQNYPNPFNPLTTIEFELMNPQLVRLTVYDVTGRTVDSLFEGWTEAGRHEVIFDGSAMASGTYFYRLQWQDGEDTKMMLLVK